MLGSPLLIRVIFLKCECRKAFKKQKLIVTQGPVMLQGPSEP